MNIEEFKEIFCKESQKIDIAVTDDMIEKLYKYMLGIIEWNDKINVTAITDEKMFIVKHFIDSLTVARFVKDKKEIIDIGTGAGFPGIPLKIVNPEMKVTLIDSVNKKLNVIRDLSEKLNLEDIEIIHTRAEDLANNKKYREQFDVAVTRAVSNFSTIAEYMLPFVKLGGIAVCMKGPNYKEELDDAQNAIKLLGGKIEKIESLNVNDALERNIIIVKKINKTPNKYPRGQGKPLKEPIR